MHASTRSISALLLGAIALSGCASLSREQKGAIIGGATGAAVGGVIGNNTGSTTRGVILGAMIGGAAGAIIGNRMDKQAREIAQQIPGAKVERVGEGIQVTFESGLLYDFDSDVVRGAARQNLATLASSLDQYPDTDLLIVGHTDDVGSDSYNQGLSERRARAAAEYLASQGVERSRLRTLGLGEAEPLASNTTDTGRHQNRRVEIAIYANEELRRKAQGS
jgi:outer membrane protein OmpA-like peptidoglycan-associated protein